MIVAKRFSTLWSAENTRGAAAITLLVMIYLLGGSGGNIPFRAMILQEYALVTLVVFVLTWRPVPYTKLLLCSLAALVAVPAIQLVPLAPSIWHNLPGREVAVGVATLLHDETWHPLSLDPDATLGSLYSLLVPIAMFIVGIQLSPRSRASLLKTIVAIAVLSLVYGMIQVGSGRAELYLFPSANQGLPVGLMSNRNHQADLLILGILAAATLQFQVGRERLMSKPWIAVILPLGAGIVATGSRAGLALALIGGCGLLFALLKPQLDRKLLISACVALILTGGLLTQNGVVQATLDRFGGTDVDQRLEIWPEVIFAIGHYFPTGAGMGTFVSSFAVTEPLSTLGVHFINRAHSDYLEFVLEAGIIGIAAMMAFLSALVIIGWKALSRPAEEDGGISRMALIYIALILLHSVVDYPLRTVANAGSFALLFGMLSTSVIRRRSL